MMLPQPSPDSDLGCAVNLNGSLKNALEIEWHFDKDSDNKIPLAASSAGPSGPASAVSKSETTQTLHPFFLGHVQAPAIFIAGSHCSGHAICPSNCVVDPDNAMNSAPGPSKSKVINLTIGKQKAPITQKPSCHVVQKTGHMDHTMTVQTTSEDSNDDNNSGDDLDHMPVPSGHPSQPTSMHGKSTDDRTCVMIFFHCSILVTIVPLQLSFSL